MLLINLIYNRECSELTIYCIESYIKTAIIGKLDNLKNLYLNFHWCKHIDEKAYLNSIIELLGSKK